MKKCDRCWKEVMTMKKMLATLTDNLLIHLFLWTANNLPTIFSLFDLKSSTLLSRSSMTFRTILIVSTKVISFGSIFAGIRATNSPVTELRLSLNYSCNLFLSSLVTSLYLFTYSCKSFLILSISLPCLSSNSYTFYLN